MCGAGGGGAGGNGYHPYGGGGDGGNAGTRVTHALTTVIPEHTYTIIVGAPGSGGAPFRNGAAGGSSSALGYTASGGAEQGSHGGTTTGQNGPISGGSGGSRGGCSIGLGAPGGSGYGAGGGGGCGNFDGSYHEAAGGGGSGGYVTITYVALTPSITPTPASGTAPLDVSFTGGVSGGSASAYDWDYGDGSAHGGTQSPTHQYAVPGSMAVIFTVTNSYGSWSDTETISVYWKPSAHVFVISTEPWRR